ncbi:MAG: iron-sulfur cluster repair di-iron protein, ric [Firmicutes bacterium]|nr:iron-sulfur cluster repair di-iron protein, ric [Bacillota bacterium]
MVKFLEVFNKHFEKLESYVPVVARVHGGTHPEFHDVKRVYETIKGKIKEESSESLSLLNELEELRSITDNYTVPDDVCVTYEAIYNMLKEIDDTFIRFCTFA